LVADGAYLKSYPIFLIFLHQYGGMDNAYTMSYSTGVTKISVTLQLQQKLYIVHLIQINTCILLANVELGGKPGGRNVLVRIFSVICVHMRG